MAANTTPTAKIPEKRKQGVPLNVYIPYDSIWLKAEIERLAKENNRSVSEIAVTALVEFVEKHSKKK